MRGIRHIQNSRQTQDGAGVRLNRAFGYYDIPNFDPFLLLDFFGSDNPDDYIAGFPWHPHRGIETITYMLHGDVEHDDSLGNGGVIGAGDVQWMTAGSGIIHQEMPHQDDGLLAGFQLWANLPSSHKMMDPRYRDIKAEEIPIIEMEGGAKIKVISGEVEGVSGPVKDIITEPEYLDVQLPSDAILERTYTSDHTVFAYLYEGNVQFHEDQTESLEPRMTILYGPGDQIRIKALEDDSRFLLISGKPIGEPIAWRGPIVMNTNDELRLAFQEYRDDSFIKHG